MQDQHGATQPNIPPCAGLESSWPAAGGPLHAAVGSAHDEFDETAGDGGPAAVTMLIDLIRRPLWNRFIEDNSGGQGRDRTGDLPLFRRKE
jgi:hypothetical protein